MTEEPEPLSGSAFTLIELLVVVAMIDGNGDTPFNFYQWQANAVIVREFLRHHGRRGNTMWLDGHASQAKEGKTTWYEQWFVGRPGP